uniref:Transmembrane protein 147 n=1 Tax=Steinernema glaseri TaxID=37863 RepID=A0A1I7ZCZ9_9BILA
MDANQQNPVVNAGEEHSDLFHFAVNILATAVLLPLSYNYEDSSMISIISYKLALIFAFSTLMIIGKWVFPAWGRWFDNLAQAFVLYKFGDIVYSISIVQLVPGLQK